MFRDNTMESESHWASGADLDATTPQDIDLQLRRLAKHRAGLDADEARWLRRAESANIWRVLGYVHALEYLEDVFGYAPRTAQERLRVARELGALPRLELELETGNMPYSIIRELTRIATPDTEASWIEKARGRNYRQVEQMLAGHKKGDEPTDDPNPALVEHDVTWKLDAATRALLRETRARLEDELGHALDDAIFVDMLCRRAMEDVSVDTSGANRVSPPSTMCHITTCRQCKTSVQHGAGVPFALTNEQVERAECDAIIVDDEQGKRASSKIPAAMRRLVFARDQYRCRLPGCRSARNLDIHHLKHRADGGGHTSGNLGLLCGGHHKLTHDGVIDISGDADGELVFTRNGVEIRGEGERLLGGPAHVPPPATDRDAAPKPPALGNAGSRYREVERNTLAKAALQQSGFKPAIAARAVERATSAVPRDATLEVLLKEAFRHCN